MSSTATKTATKTVKTHSGSAIAYAEQFFNAALAAGQMQVSNMALHKYVGEHTGQSHAVLNGTLDGTGLGTLIGATWYTARWYKKKLDNGRIVHVQGVGARDIAQQREMNYDSSTKRQACEKIMLHLPATGHPRLLTLASASGNCVQAALRRNPNTRIYNIEYLKDVFDLWQTKKRRLGIETTDYFCSFQDFVNAPGFTDTRYALINADVMGYACQQMYIYLRVINAAKNANIIALTTQRLDAFRNTGAFQEALRKKYAGSRDAHAQCIADWLDNYEMVDRFSYQKDAGTRHMEVFIFRLVEGT